MAAEVTVPHQRSRRGFISRKSATDVESANQTEKPTTSTWNMGMLNDKETIEVPGRYSRIPVVSIATNILNDECRLGFASCQRPE
jgi:hypothetical protein